MVSSVAKHRTNFPLNLSASKGRWRKNKPEGNKRRKKPHKNLGKEMTETFVSDGRGVLYQKTCPFF